MTDVDRAWLRAGAYASLDGIELAMVRHTAFRDMPLSISRGQATAYFLTDRQRRSWILKKFLPGRDPDATYVRAIRDLVPPESGFESGSQRRVLSASSVGNGFNTSEFPAWIEGTILMPTVPGSDWANLAESLRGGTVSLSREQRIAICKSFVARVAALEAAGVSHRDLAVTNVFIDPTTWDVHLIDWDGIYHRSLAMPSNTTVGTDGYTVPFVRSARGDDPALTWCPYADRFAMTILCVEFLLLDRTSPLANDGGLFEQQELFARNGPHVQQILGALRRQWRDVAGFLERSLQAKTFDDCPSPAEWRQTESIRGAVDAPSLKDVGHFMADFRAHIHRLQQVTPPPPAPSIASLPPIDRAALQRAIAPASPPPSAPRLDDLPTK